MTFPSILAMQTLSISIILLISATPQALSLSSPSSASLSNTSSIYIVHVDHEAMPSPFRSSFHWHTAILSSLHSDPSSEPPPVHIYTYREVTSGFSAALTPSQAEKLRAVAGFLSAYADSPARIQLLTTRTPEFLGLSRRGNHDDQPQMGRLWAESRQGEGQIIGVVDSGIWPESRSFKDYNMPDVPRHWLGLCETGDEFNSSYCNRKLIGARSFSKALKRGGHNISTTDDYDSPRDFLGHGTQVSSVAAGSPVDGAEYFGYAKGRAVGMAPKAHLAMYKMGFSNLRFQASDILAAIDQAISDGVTVLSLSIASPNEFDRFDKNPIALGTFAAMQKGIFVACAAGNVFAGPMYNGEPWVTTVGSGTMDRDFGAIITLRERKEKEGDKAHLTITGRSIFPANYLVRNVNVSYGYGNASQEKCLSGAIDPLDVSDKFVLCTGSLSHDEVREIPRLALGAIISSGKSSLLDFTSFSQPFVYVTSEDADRIRNYLILAKDPILTVKFLVTFLEKKPAPQVNRASSRGPYAMSPWVFKPDILAPGGEVLGATVPIKASATLDHYDIISEFSLKSGTSLSAPHVAGIAALLKNVHPSWSPAAIRSAMMTTASISDNRDEPISDLETGTVASPLDYGAGHINPNKAIDPGLIYDIGVQEYVNLLCAMNYTETQIKILTHKHSPASCTSPSLDLNYPAFVVVLESNTRFHTFQRVVTHVGTDTNNGVVSYTAKIQSPTGMRIWVQPARIIFTAAKATAEFRLSVELDLQNNTSVGHFNKQFGFLIWESDNGRYLVKSPVVASFRPIKPSATLEA